MAPPEITKNVFLVILPDYPTPEAKEGRKTFFPAHLESPMVKESGFIVVAGVLLPDDANSLDAGALGKGQGSTGYVQAESLEKVWEIIKADALWTNGVWDKEKAMVFPVALLRANSFA